MAADSLSLIGVASTSEAVGGYYGGRSGVGILDGWLVHEGDHADIEGVEVRSVPLLMTDPATTAEMVRAGLDLAGLKAGPTPCKSKGLALLSKCSLCQGFPSFARATTSRRPSPQPHRGCAT